MHQMFRTEGDGERNVRARMEFTAPAIFMFGQQQEVSGEGSLHQEVIKPEVWEAH